MPGEKTPKGDYEVGFGRPPRHSQFQRGRSGNPKGRPGRRRNLKTDLEAELFETVTLKEGGREVRISKQRAMVKSMVAKAIGGDQRAVAKAFELLLTLIGAGKDGCDTPSLSEQDDAILAAFLERNKEETKP